MGLGFLVASSLCYHWAIMYEATFNTLQIHDCVQRWQAGDRFAADTLLRAVGHQLEHLTRNMLRGFPNVRSQAETADVFQGSMFRLLQTLQKIQPQSTRHFLNLAALHIRRELLDLARSFAARRERTFSADSATGADISGEPAAWFAQVPDSSAPAPDDLELWCRFHENVERLPMNEREVISLCFYHGLTQAQIADLFQVDERTVRRRWQSACMKLKQLVGGELPTS